MIKEAAASLSSANEPWSPFKIQMQSKNFTDDRPLEENLKEKNEPQNIS